MKIRFKNKKLKELCESQKELTRTFGEKRTKKIMNRLTVLANADCLEHVSYLPPEKRHQLGANLAGHFAISIEDQWRIILRPDYDDVPLKEDGGIDLKKVCSIRIMDICEDYH